MCNALNQLNSTWLSVIRITQESDITAKIVARVHDGAAVYIWVHAMVGLT